MGSLLDGCKVDDATAAAASPAFMCGAVLLPLMDSLMCQVCMRDCGPTKRAYCLSGSSRVLLCSGTVGAALEHCGYH